MSTKTEKLDNEKIAALSIFQVNQKDYFLKKLTIIFLFKKNC